MADREKTVFEEIKENGEISRFVESYASFNRIINSLQRKYIELEGEFSAQNDRLASANRKLVDLSERNLVANEFLGSILDSISAGVIAIDRNGRVTHFNRAASQILGIPRQAPLGRPYREVVLPGKPVHANALRAAETGQDVTSVDKTVKLPDGSRRHLSVSTTVLRDTQGQAAGAVEVLQDLTKIRKMEQELARLNTLAALGEMAATVAHEVRNPLNGIAGFAELLERDLEDSDPRKETAGKILRSVETLNSTVETLLTYSRIEEINRAEVSYEDFLETAVTQFQTENSERLGAIEIAVNSDRAGGEPPFKVVLDRVLYRQVLFNVLDNAMRVLGEKGEIGIRFSRLPRLEALMEYSDRLVLDIGETVLETTISDNGPGIKADDLERVFSPFYSTRPGGNGLGLAVAWKIIKAHGGEMRAEQRPEGGSLFRILLPTRMDNVSREHSK